MKLSDVMSLYPAPDPAFIGIATNDDMVLAVDITPSRDAEINSYVVVQSAIEGVDAQLNATTTDKTYLRAGLSSTKTGVQRTYAVTGDRQHGDEFQDYAMETIYKTGQAVVVPYIWFSKLTGKGEKGTCAILVNSDGGGNAGETAAISIDLRKTGAMPEPFNYAAPGSLIPLTLTSEAGSIEGTTRVTPAQSIPAGYAAKWHAGTTVTLPEYDATLTGTWAAFMPGVDYPANDGDDFGVVYVDTEGRSKYAGKTTAIVAQEG